MENGTKNRQKLEKIFHYIQRESFFLEIFSLFIEQKDFERKDSLRFSYFLFSGNLLFSFSLNY